MKNVPLKLAESKPGWKDLILVSIGLMLLASLFGTLIREDIDERVREQHYAVLSANRTPASLDKVAITENGADESLPELLQNDDRPNQVLIPPFTLQERPKTERELPHRLTRAITTHIAEHPNRVDGSAHDAQLDDKHFPESIDQTIRPSRTYYEGLNHPLNTQANSAQHPQSRLPRGIPLDASTLEQYSKIHEMYPHFKGWVEVPEFGLSYPLFVDPDDPMAYLHKDHRGRPNAMGEVHYQGEPGTSEQLIVFGHTLVGRKGFAGLDVLPELGHDEIQSKKLDVWLDLQETGQRYRFQIIKAEYRVRADTQWAITDFGEGPFWAAFNRDLGLREAPTMLLTLSTCRKASSTVKSVVYAVPVDLM